MRSTSYRELWTNVSLDRWAVNFMQMRYARSLLFNCCLSLNEISCFKGLKKRYKLKKTRLPKMRTSRIVKSMSSTSSHWMPNSYGFYRKAEDVEVRFYGMVNAHIASEVI